MAHTHDHQNTGDIRVAFFLNLGFTIVEIIGGLWTNSAAIVADALHDLGDSLSLGLAWFLERYSNKGRDATFSYGYRRFSLLGALVNAIVLVTGSVFVLATAMPRILHPEPVNAAGMLGFAVAGIVVNGLAVLRVKKGKSLNAQVVTWHLLEDVLGWVAVLVVSIVMLFVDWYILDPTLSILITVYVLYNVVRNLRKTLVLFLQGVPSTIDMKQVEQRLQAIEGILSTHHTHLWSLDGEHNVLTTHVVVESQATKETMLRVKSAVLAIGEELECEHTTVEMEYEDEDCRLRTP